MNKEIRCNDEQYEMLLRCSGKKDISEWNAWRKANPDVEIWLEGAKFTEAHLAKADLIKAHLAGAEFLGTHLEEAVLSGACLEGAELQSAHLEKAQLPLTQLEGANMLGAYIEKAVFIGAMVDAKTLILKCRIDEKTDFTLVGLDNARVEPSLLTRLKTNIRRIAWEKYYRGMQNTWHGKLKAFLIRSFWELSDYGSNTAKVLRKFFFITLSFAAIYGILDLAYPDLLVENSSELLRFSGTPEEQFHFGHSLANASLWLLQIWCFTVGTMMTLGFGGINVAILPSTPWSISFAGLLLVTVNLMLGYFLLAVLVTRIGIMFQSIGPEAEIPPPQLPDKSNIYEEVR